jgi:flagellar motor switch protein FliN/FliY
VTGEAALARLGESTSRAATALFEQLAPGQVQPGGVSVIAGDGNLLEGVPTPAVAMSVSYVDGVTGGNVFVMTLAACRSLATKQGAEPSEEGGELSELELSAVSEAMNQMIAAAAAATSKVIGEEVEISTPATHVLASPADAEGIYAKTPHAVIVGFRIFGESCRLVQLIPNAFVVRIGRALGEQTGDVFGEERTDAAAFGGDVLRDVALRVWAELGRARLPIGRAVGLSPGSVVELDKAADEPVDLYVNGRRFASGRLLLAEDGEWAVRIEEIATTDSTPLNSKEGA